MEIYKIDENWSKYRLGQGRWPGNTEGAEDGTWVQGREYYLLIKRRKDKATERYLGKAGGKVAGKSLDEDLGVGLGKAFGSKL